MSLSRSTGTISMPSCSRYPRLFARRSTIGSSSMLMRTCVGAASAAPASQRLASAARSAPHGRTEGSWFMSVVLQELAFGGNPVEGELLHLLADHRGREG